ncbi:MAG TPA: hypothetical protein VGP32_07910 [Steroidobacteraceae bacterium]|jgi:hypothetical protein|nr:hypothetical protein [Steroidobacteraceae bacterium]
MRFRLTAFGLHLLGSACALTLVLGALYLGWYRWPGWYLSSVLHVVGIVVLVDLVIGPTLTLIVANPGKRRRLLARDIAMIVTVQLAALIYGAVTLWSGRPLYYLFSANRLEFVQASDIDSTEIVLARRQNPSLAPHWYSLPRWVWAPLPDDPEEAMKIVDSATFGGGKDVIDMPRYFKPWEQGLPKLRDQLARLDDIKYFSKVEKKSLRARMSAARLAPDERNALIMWGGSRRLLAVFDPATLRIRALLLPG